MKQIMIDIETLGLRPDSIVLSIGACVFDLDGSIHETVHLHPRFVEGRFIDPATVVWWMQQGDNARASITSTLRETRDDCADELLRLIRAAGTEKQPDTPDGQPVSKFTPPMIWAMGPQMDIVVLENYFSGLTPLWTYRQIADCRTLRQLYKVEMEPTGGEHSAINDAIAQAKWTAAALRHLSKVTA